MVVVECVRSQCDVQVTRRRGRASSPVSAVRSRSQEETRAGARDDAGEQAAAESHHLAECQCRALQHHHRRHSQRDAHAVLHHEIGRRGSPRRRACRRRRRTDAGAGHGAARGAHLADRAHVHSRRAARAKERQRQQGGDRRRRPGRTGSSGSSASAAPVDEEPEDEGERQERQRRAAGGEASDERHAARPRRSARERRAQATQLEGPASAGDLSRHGSVPGACGAWRRRATRACGRSVTAARERRATEERGDGLRGVAVELAMACSSAASSS